MSQITPVPVREPVEVDGRHMTPARRARIITRDGGVCRYPECEITTDLKLDHIVALALGGKDHDRNLQLLCDDHHKAKTRIDQALIAKAKRRKLKNDGDFPPAKQKIRSQGFRPRWQA